MRRHVWPSALCLLFAASLALDDARAEDDGPVPIEPSPAMATRLRWPQYAMVSGRIVVSSSQEADITVPASTSQEGRRRERQTLNLHQQSTNIQYELTTPTEQFSLSIVDSVQISVQRATHDGKYAMRFAQEPGRPLQFTLEEDNSKRTWSGESFWHLTIAAGDAVRRHLIPVLEVLNPNWQLASLSEGIEETLFARAQSIGRPDRQRWIQWVDALASSKFSERQQAQRELLKAGQVVVPFLQSLDRDKLDAEQAFRVRSVVEALAVGYEDTADRVVVWLSNDDQVWLTLLARGELDKRRVAVEQLRGIWGTAVEFDPEAPQPERAAQLERLQASRSKSQPSRK